MCRKAKKKDAALRSGMRGRRKIRLGYFLRGGSPSSSPEPPVLTSSRSTTWGAGF
jgi:hypothetical protein